LDYGIVDRLHVGSDHGIIALVSQKSTWRAKVMEREVGV